MDRPGAAEPAEVLNEDFGFIVDLVQQTVTFEGGYTASIAEMLDQRGDETDVPREVRFIIVEMPPDGIWITIDLDDLRRGIFDTIH
jgi:hypothetical protein